VSATPIFKRFKTLLIANRGEIACRVIRTARAMGLRTVAVYSDADANALHVTMADDAVRIGPPRARDSYLNIDAILDAAHKSGAEAIHPGYGFLSESSDFAARCAQAGLVFVGPSADMIEAMGSKSHAKALMETAGVPLVPGYHGEAQDDATLTAAANKIGYPVLVKASAGGGGRGMRVVRDAASLEAALSGARRESKAAFDDDRLLIEKYVDNPRHIEVQVIGDSHGNLVSLFERECTLQRRHQKVIEEAPSPTLNDAQRERIAAAARKAAGAISYIGAGTIEFVSDGKDVFFIEMNTRLQVEHPVTELVTGVDLVEWQLRVAFGEALPLKQQDIRLRGHAVEARIYAENPAKNFMPSTGTIKSWRMPPADNGLRIDSGYEANSVVSPYYDAMLAKMIAFAPDRATALSRLAQALDETDIRGVTTNVEFLSNLVGHPAVGTNDIDTGFIERELVALAPPPARVTSVEFAAIIARIVHAEMVEAAQDGPSPQHGAWMPVGERRRRFGFRDGEGVEHAARLIYGRDGLALDTGDGLRALTSDIADDVVQLTLDGESHAAVVLSDGREFYTRTRNGRFVLVWIDPFTVDAQIHAADNRIVAPLPGTVVAIFAGEGAVVDKGDPVLTVEVMKMEHTLRAPFAGKVTRLTCKVGDAVQEGALLADIEASD
jgi:3-methylcrotonyl-CoA carboxylase alpha subunit